VFAESLPGDAQCQHADGYTAVCARGMFARKDERDKGVHKKSPLEMLIESIEEVLAAFDDTSLIASVGPNPFNCDPRHYRFQPARDYHHDITLLKSQLAGLREILAEIESFR